MRLLRMRHRAADRPVREGRINTMTQRGAAVRDAQPGAENVRRGADGAAQRTDGRLIGCGTAPSSSSALPCTTNHRRAAAMRCEIPSLPSLTRSTACQIGRATCKNHRSLQLGTSAPLSCCARPLPRSCSAVPRRHRSSISPPDVPSFSSSLCVGFSAFPPFVRFFSSVPFGFPTSALGNGIL